jgi:hypothetical protein
MGTLSEFPMNQGFVRRMLWMAAWPLIGAASSSLAQDQPDLTGMYSDPQGLEDFFCFFWCSDPGLDYLNALLDDPANDERPVMELYTEAATYQRDEYLKPLLTPEGAATLGLDPADDPAFLLCEPMGFAREIFVPHQLQIEQFDDRVEMLYGEWTIRRTVHMDGRAAPADVSLSPMGYSVGRYEGDVLVIETTGISENLAPWGGGFLTLEVFDGRHSDGLSAVERYRRSADGQRLILNVTLDDPWALSEPVTLRKVWHWAPDQEIAPYEDCEIPTEFSRGVNQP